MNIINADKGSSFLIRLAGGTRSEWRQATSLGTVKKWNGTEVQLEVEGVSETIFITPTTLHPYVGLLQDSALVYCGEKTRSNWCSIKKL